MSEPGSVRRYAFSLAALDALDPDEVRSALRLRKLMAEWCEQDGGCESVPEAGQCSRCDRCVGHCQCR